MTAKEIREMPTAELEKRCRRLGDELYEMRLELSRRKGDVPSGVKVDFEQYVTN